MADQNYKLSDGITIKGSSTNPSGYRGVAYSPSWTDPNSMSAKAKKPFIATLNRKWVEEQDPRAADYLSGGKVFHLGAFDDSRQAAYAAAKFASNVKGYLDRWFKAPEGHRSFGAWGAPKDLMDLPLITPQDAEARRTGKKDQTTQVDPAKEQERLSSMDRFKQIQADPEIAQYLSNMTSSRKNEVISKIRDIAMKTDVEITDKVMKDLRGVARWAASQLNESAELDRVKQLIKYKN